MMKFLELVKPLEVARSWTFIKFSVSSVLAVLGKLPAEAGGTVSATAKME